MYYKINHRQGLESPAFFKEKGMFNLGIISAMLYVFSQVIANILSTKIALIPFMNLSMDGGTIIYPLTFTLRDFVHKSFGKKKSRGVVISAGILSFAAALLFWLVGKMPADPSWHYQKDYGNILIPVFRITLASVAAQIVSELADTEIFSFFYKKFSDIIGSFFSNCIALIIDSLIFCSLAFLGTLPLFTVVKIMLANILVKFLLSTVSVPAIKLIPRTAPMDEI